MNSADQVATAVGREAAACLRYGMEKIDHCLGQLTSEQVWWRPRPEMNAIGNLLLHLGGNLSQWILAGVGNGVDSRDRPREFAERRALPQEELRAELLAVVEQSCAVLEQVRGADLMELRRIQGFEVSKAHAMLHSVTHFQGHVQEIIGLTRQQLGSEYTFQWQPTTAEEGAD